jgi:hypothetical protein
MLTNTLKKEPDPSPIP